MSDYSTHRKLLFTKRELETLQLLAIGNTHREIAELQGIGYYTARQHVKSMLSKIQAPNSAALVRMSIERGYLKIRQELAYAG